MPDEIDKVSDQHGDGGKLFDEPPEDNTNSELVSIQYSGPLPPASEFARYDATTPGAGDRILSLTERQADHRQRMEVEEASFVRQHATSALNEKNQAAKRGQYFAAGLSLALIFFGFYAITIGYPKTAAAIVGTNIVALAAVFLIGKKSKDRIIITEDLEEDDDDD